MRGEQSDNSPQRNVSWCEPFPLCAASVTGLESLPQRLKEAPSLASRPAVDCSLNNLIVYFQRKRREGRNFSLEQIFEDVRSRVSTDFDTEVHVAPVLSNGLLRRLWIIISAAFAQGRINHVTGDINFATLLMRKERTVLTLLDCGILERTHGLRRLMIRLIWFQLPVMRSQIVTVISEATRQSLLTNIGCSPKKIRVIPVAISERFSRKDGLFNTNRPTVLQIGTAPNKNLDRVAQCLKGLPCKLQIIGPVSSSQRGTLQEAGIDFDVAQGLSESELIRKYVECDLVLFASTSEGFGMPILEANAVGRPVITSNTTSMPEVAGDAACLVDPFDCNSIRHGIDRVISDADYRKRLVEAGFRNVLRFRGDRIAKEYISVYREIVDRAA
jgi:glycosyltransferase involved in cell wall biosynthesis